MHKNFPCEKIFPRTIAHFLNEGNKMALAGYKVAKNVTLPHFKLDKDRQYFFQLTGLITLAKNTKSTKPGGEETVSASERKQPPHLVQVINLESGEIGQIIVPAVLKSELEDNYPDGQYVGRSFAIMLYRVPGKDYNLVNLAEIEPDEAQVQAPATGTDDATPITKGKRR